MMAAKAPRDDLDKAIKPLDFRPYAPWFLTPSRQTANLQFAVSG
jgi:hypothetical protein